MKVPLLDLKAQYASIRDEISEAVNRVFEAQWFIHGPEVQACEEEIAAYCGCAHAVGVSSGTDALLVALMSEGIGPGDEVITTPYTFFATAGSIARTGARPVFVDIDPETFNLVSEQVAAAVTGRTRAIMPVHLFGRTADMQPLLYLAEQHGLAVIEDAAQAIGAEYRGQRAGSLGAYGCFSFFPSKNLGGAGDGGIVTTNDPERCERLVRLRDHGMKPKYYHTLLGGNFRLDALQAAVVRVKLQYLDAWTEARQTNAARYDRLFREAGLVDDGSIILPALCPDRQIFNQYVIRVKERDALRAHLLEQDIGTEVYYPVPLHRQDCFAYLGCSAGAFPESERAARETLALPIYPELSDEQAAFVTASIQGWFSAGR